MIPTVLSRRIGLELCLDPNFDPLNEEFLTSIPPTVKSTDIPVIDVIWQLPKNSEECDNTGNSFVVCLEHPETKSRHEYHCNRPECPRCYSYWAYREGERASIRLTASRELYSKAGKPIGPEKHFAFSPPQEWAKKCIETLGGYRELRDEAMKIMKECGVLGGVLIFHSHRKDKNNKWFISPHFHLIGWGYLKKSDDFYDDTGWVYKNKGVRKSVKKTIAYLLTHVGLCYYKNSSDFHKPVHSITWFGVVAYNKVSKESVNIELVTRLCPICSQPMQLAYELANGDFYSEGDYYYKREHWSFRLNGTLFSQQKIILDFG